MRPLFFLLGLVAFVSSCRKSAPLVPAQVRAVTRELADAARSVGGERVVVTTRPERLRSDSATMRGGDTTSDRIFITLPVARNGQTDPALPTALERELDRVARGHHLRRVPRSAAPGFIRFDYEGSGQQTQAVEIIIPLGRSRPAGDLGAPRLAVIVDDLGQERSPAETLLSLTVPVTFAVLPHLPYSEVIAEEAGRRGFEVLLHLPIQPEGGVMAGTVELRPGMSPAAVERAVAEMLETVPNATGVNNHEGSRGTADPILMRELMAVLARRNLFFVDSRTTVKTVAYDAAVRAGVPSASRNVFLDDTVSAEAIRGQLHLAVEDALRNGAAIAIGHPHPETLAVLVAELPKLSREGVALVFASELCSRVGRPKTAQVSRASQPPSWPLSAQSPARR